MSKATMSTNGRMIAGDTIATDTIATDTIAAHVANTEPDKGRGLDLGGSVVLSRQRVCPSEPPIPHGVPIREQRQAGSMLIVCLAVLTLMTIIAVTFAALMRLERHATENYRNSNKAELLGGSAESRVIAMMRGGLYWSGHTQHTRLASPWIYGLRAGKSEQRLGNRMPLETANEEETSVFGDLGGTYPQGIDRYRVKVIDCTAQININGQQDNLALMLDNLGAAIASDTDYNKINPFYSEANQKGKAIRGQQIIRYRNRLDGRRFQSKTQLKPLIGEENYRILADFITTQGWEDKSTQRGSDGRPEFNIDPDSVATVTAANLDPNAQVGQSVVGSRPQLTPEPRFPININTAPRPVLVAALMGISGRAPFPYTDVFVDQGIEENNIGAFEIDGSLAQGREELTLNQFPVWVHTQPLGINEAQQIANLIIQARKAQPFTRWEGNGRPGGFNDFVNGIPDNVFPPATSITVVAPQDPRSPRYKNGLLNLSNKSGTLFAKGHSNSEVASRRQAGMLYSQRNAFYAELIRGVVMANFNPNTRLNRYNPNTPAYQSVDKANLIRLGTNGTDPLTPRPGHTTDFCFDTHGIFEITTVGEIKGGGYADQEVQSETYAQVKRRSIVKIWETQRHTTQKDFERPFTAAGKSSVNDRQYVSSYPDAMDLLHPDFDQGSEVDGNVQLMGFVDALRQPLSPSIREQFFQGRAQVLLYHGFRYRKDVERLRSLGRTSRGGQAYVSELRKVLDPSFARESGFNKRYSTDNWGGAADDSGQDRIINEPVVNTVARGTDVHPDGLLSSYYTSSNLGARFLRFPASRYRQNPADEGELNRNYQNDIGNLAYYNGGVAFWVKLAVDGDDPVVAGFVGGTQVQTAVGGDPSDSEGTQFYVYKNTSGQLRVSRLYYHQAFDSASTNALPDIGEGGAQEEEAEEELTDPQKAWGRTDVLVDINDWRAHEWHHVVVEWNDILTADRVRVRIDFEDQDAVCHNLGEQKFCALNERFPKDGIFVGGIFRNQAVAKEGIFKFGTNYDQKGALRDESAKRLVCNGTIDEFESFTGGFNSQYGVVGYFTDKQGIYANSFRVPLPEGIRRVRLRSLNWTVYAPKLYAGGPVRWNPDTQLTLSAFNVDSGAQGRPLTDAGGSAQSNRSFAGRYLYSTTAQKSGRFGELAYEVRMNAALGLGNRYGGSTVQTPVLDDVTLTYYLPSAQVLLTETY